jgi:DNA repair exonuclease SbcCD nuclease subunit
MRMLIIGDVHCKSEDLDECEKLLEFVKSKIIDEKSDYCWFTGDQTNFFNVCHVDVLNFWHKWALELSKNCKVIFTVGNHDISKNDPQVNAMTFLKGIPEVYVIDKPTEIDNKLFLPYYRNNDDVIKYCNQSDKNAVFCHATFLGSRFENNWYAKEAINLQKIKQNQVFSGHIHRPQRVGKCVYVGSPRWLIVSDANDERFIWSFDFDENNNIIEEKAFYTNQICKPIYFFEDSKENPFNPDEKYNNARVTIDIKGDANYIKTRKQYLSELGYKVRGSPIRQATSKIKESMGPKLALSTFIDGYVAKNGTSQTRLRVLSQERIEWMR